MNRISQKEKEKTNATYPCGHVHYLLVNSLQEMGTKKETMKNKNKIYCTQYIIWFSFVSVQFKFCNTVGPGLQDLGLGPSKERLPHSNFSTRGTMGRTEPFGHTLYRGIGADKATTPPRPLVSDTLYNSEPTRWLVPGQCTPTRRPQPGPQRTLARPPLSCYPAHPPLGTQRSSWPWPAVLGPAETRQWPPGHAPWSAKSATPR